MAQPTEYQRQYDFEDFQSSNPTTPLPADQIEAEYDAVKVTLDQILTNLAIIQRDDTKLANLSVHPDALDSAVKATIASSSFNIRGAWADMTAYAVGDVVTDNGIPYLNFAAHTSSGSIDTSKFSPFGSPLDFPVSGTDDDKFLRASGGVGQWVDLTASHLTDVVAALQSVITAADVGAARTALGITATGDSLVTAADAAAVRDVIDVRTKLTANTDFYVDPINGSDSNDGLTTGTEKQTLQAMLDTLHVEYDLNGFVATINWEGGAAITTNVSVSGPFTGAENAGSVVITGPSSDPDDFHINVASGTAFTARHGARLTLQNISATADAAHGIRADTGGHIAVENYKCNGALRQTPGGVSLEGAALIAIDGGVIEVNGDVEIAGDMDTILNAQHESYMQVAAGITVTFTGTLDLSADLYCRAGSVIRFTNFGGNPVIFSTGGATFSHGDHRPFVVEQNGSIGIVGGDYNSWPSSAGVGIQRSGGVYNHTVSGIRPKVVSFTHDISVTGVQNITAGLGFRPSAIIIIGSQNAVAGMASWGMGGSAPGTTQEHMRDENNGTANSYNTSSTNANIITINQGGGNVAAAAYGPTNDGFSLTWSKTGTPTGTFTGMALVFP